MKKTALCVIMCLILFAIQCDKTEKGPERKAISFETPVEVTLPATTWEKTVVIQSVTGGSGSPEKEALLTILTQQMAGHFSETNRLRVVSIDADEKRQDIKPDYVLDNQTEEADGVVKTAFRLTDTRTDSVVWTTTFEEEIESFWVMEETASSSAIEAMGVPPQAPRQPTSPAHSPEILKRYLSARSLLLSGTREDIDRAIDEFKEILRQDSTFAPAFTGLAASYLKLVDMDSRSHSVWLRLAQESAIQSVRIDPDLAEGHLSLAQSLLARGDFKQAEDAFRKALAINSGLVEAWTGLGQVLTHYGLYEPCLRVYDKVQALNPSDADVALSKSMILTGLGQYREAESEIRRTLDTHPDAKHLHSFLALNRYYLGDFTEALQQVHTGLESDAYLPFAHSVLGMIYARQQKPDEALGEVELEVKPYAGSNGSLASAVAAVYALIGQKGQAMQWLEKAYAWGYREYPWLTGDPNFDSMKTDERFIAYLEKLKTGWREKMLAYQDRAVL